MREIIAVENITRLTQLTQVKCGWITQVIWSPNGAALAIASANGVRIYLGQFGGTPTHEISGHDGHVKGVAFSPDGRLLATVAADTLIKLWDLSTETIVESATLKGHRASVDTVAFSPDGQTLAVGSADTSITLWDVQSRSIRARLEGHEKEVTSLAFGMNGNVVFSGSWDHTIRVWDVGAETGGAVFGEHDDWVRGLAVNPPGTMLASASKDMTVRLWDVYDSTKLYALIHAHDLGADTVAFSPDGTLLATGGRDHVIRLWSVHRLLADEQATKRDALITLVGHEKPIMSLAFNPAGTLLASASGDNTVRLWSIK
ncbi:MAG: hypothetical protein Kow00117_16380 [Phototrophicales bacterium]